MSPVGITTGQTSCTSHGFGPFGQYMNFGPEPKVSSVNTYVRCTEILDDTGLHVVHMPRRPSSAIPATSSISLAVHAPNFSNIMSQPDIAEHGSFANRTVIVTGAAGTIGAPLCIAFAKAGANVVANDLEIGRASCRERVL